MSPDERRRGAGGQLWQFLRHPETGEEHWVPDNPGVVPSFEEKGWQVAEAGEGQRPPGTYRADRLRLAEFDRHVALLEVTCDGGKRHPHDLEVLLVAGRDVRPGGSDFFLRGALGTAEFPTRDGDDGFKYGTGYPAQAYCPRCPARLSISAQLLRSTLAALLQQSKGEPIVVRVDHRRLLAKNRNAARSC